jgi:amidase
LARTVGDVRLGLGAVMGAHHRDPHSMDAPLGGPAVAKRVALVPEPFGGDTDAGVAEGVRIAGRALEAAGYEVDEIEPPMLFETYLSWAELMWTGLASRRELFVAFMGPDAQRFLELTNIEYPPATLESMASMHEARYRIEKAWRRFMTDYPLVVGPVWTQPPFEHGYDIIDVDTAMKVVELFRFVMPANLMGLPAACVATGVTNGLPTGVQVMGTLLREDHCLDAAEAIESSVGVLTPIDPRD